MAVNAITSTNAELYSELQIGAFTFVKELTGQVVLHVDIDSGLYPVRLTHEQTYTLAQWLCARETNDKA